MSAKKQELKKMKRRTFVEAIREDKILLIVACMFVLLDVLVWLNEGLDLPYLLLGAPQTPFNWREAATNTVMITAVGVFVVGILIRYISKRDQAKEALTASKAYAEFIIKNFLDTLVVVDVETKIKTVNPATCHLLGYTEKEIIGQPISSIFAEEEEEEEVNRFFQFFRDPEISKDIGKDDIRNKELNYKTKGGRLIPMSFNASVITDEKGNVTSVVAGAKDLTEIKLAEEARRKSEESYMKVIENIFKFVPDGLLVMTDKLNLFRENKAFRDTVEKYSTLLNYTEQELAEIIIEQVKERIINEDNTEIRISRKTV